MTDVTKECEDVMPHEETFENGSKSLTVHGRLWRVLYCQCSDGVPRSVIKISRTKDGLRKGVVTICGRSVVGFLRLEEYGYVFEVDKKGKNSSLLP